MSKKLRNILFKLELEGNGIVNFDGAGQKTLWNKHADKFGLEKATHNNTKFAKHNWHENKMEVIISSDCLRHHLFTDEVRVHSPETVIENRILIPMIASPALIIRGYLALISEGTKTSLKRSSALCITEAKQTNDAISYLETHSRSGRKTQDDVKSDNTFFKEESVGDITYSAVGDINLKSLQFISCDEVFDRLALNPDYFEQYSELLKLKMPCFSSDMRYYQETQSVINIPEYGILLSPESIQFLVKDVLTRLINLKIRRAGAYAETSKLKLKFVYDIFDDKLNNTEGWVDATQENINNLVFDPEIFVTEYDKTESIKLRKDLQRQLDEQKENNKKKKDKADAERKEKKNKQEASVNLEGAENIKE